MSRLHWGYFRWGGDSMFWNTLVARGGFISAFMSSWVPRESEGGRESQYDVTVVLEVLRVGWGVDVF